MKKYLKFILAGIILFVPFSILNYLEKGPTVIAMGVGMSMVMIVVMYANVIKSLKIGMGGTEVEMREVINKANATIEMLEKAQEPVLIYTIELMYSEGMMFSSSMDSKVEAYTGIKEFISNSRTYDKVKFNNRLKQVLFGINQSAKSDLYTIYDKFFDEYGDKFQKEQNLTEFDFMRLTNSKVTQIGSYFKNEDKGKYLKTIVDYDGLSRLGATDLPEKYKLEWDSTIAKLKDFNEKNKY
ncbi:hypothetical protein RIU76_06830 [Latilactobacillus sakei subsp. sakei]|uniref:hypothetical protein n=1 Tax=Latilactobacillus sakei TaxID=1599 RepID=UPI00285812C1|nr:hypothetical protein [Latilactobacillus sakei]MDR7924439.1 hypothetical protein [Latilactobacillus sakei subsp. sakei]